MFYVLLTTLPNPKISTFYKTCAASFVKKNGKPTLQGKTAQTAWAETTSLPVILSLSSTVQVKLCRSGMRSCYC